MKNTGQISTDQGSNTPLPHEQCSLCGSIGDREEAFYIGGELVGQNSIPPAARDLIIVQDTTYGSRLKQLKQCPQCKTFYWYWTDYEFLAGGTEDEEFLIRLRPEQVQDYLITPSNEVPSASGLPVEEPVEVPTEAPLKVPTVTLNNAQIQALQKVYRPFAYARDAYKTAEAWSCDISIPSHAIEADRQKMLTAWVSLSQVLKTLQIHDLPSSEFQLPKRFTGGRGQYSELLKWLEADQHLRDPETL